MLPQQSSCVQSQLPLMIRLVYAYKHCLLESYFVQIVKALSAPAIYETMIFITKITFCYTISTWCFGSDFYSATSFDLIRFNEPVFPSVSLWGSFCPSTSFFCCRILRTTAVLRFSLRKTKKSLDLFLLRCFVLEINHITFIPFIWS